MRLLRWISVLLAFGCGTGPAHAASVTGVVVDKATRAPLLGVEVVLRTATDSVVVAHAATGENGRFQLDGVRSGRYLLRASRLGHESLHRPDVVLVDSASTLDLGTLPLALAPIPVPGVETSTARSTVTVASDRNIYLAKDMPAASAGTATDLLRSVPELEVDINDRVSLRGSASVTIQLNGRTSPLKGDALAAFLRQYPATRIERIEVIANPSAKFDPEGMAGIVNIVTKEPLELGLSGSGHVMLGDRGSGPSSRIAWQKGRLTLHGGVSGYWGRHESRSHDQRQHLLAQPPSAYEMNSDFRNRHGFGNFDGSFDFAFDKRSTLYATTSGSASSSSADGLQHTEFADSDQGITSSYDRVNEFGSSWRSASATLGFAHVVEKSKKEWTVELRHSRTPNRNWTDATQLFFVPADSIGQVSVYEAEDASHESSLQVDDTHQVGAKGKLELGYRGAERRTHNTIHLDILSGPPGGGLSDYIHREVFHSGYATLGSTFGRFSLQGGIRAEAAHTTFDVIPRDTRYVHDYRSVFPSVNTAWDFGAGRTLRLTYSKRIERPSGWYLNPDVPSVDPYGRFVGNPYLSPKYTHSYGLEASWAGSRGLLRVAPFHRETIANWDGFKTVDASGAAVTTWLNASSIRFTGASLVASLRQTGRLGGTLNFSLYRESHDAANLSQRARHAATVWSLSGNATFKLTKALDLQTFMRYNPAQTLAQGRLAGTFFSNLGMRYKFGDKAWASLSLNDPFQLWKYEMVTNDASYTQTTTTRGTVRRTFVSFGWTWGKPPETKQRRQPDEQPQQEQPVPMR